MWAGYIDGKITPHGNVRLYLFSFLDFVGFKLYPELIVIQVIKKLYYFSGGCIVFYSCRSFISSEV